MDNQTAISAVLAGLPLPVVLVGRDARIVAANPQALALFGEGAMGRHHGMTFRQPDLLQAIAQGLNGGEVARVRHVLPGATQDSIYEVTVTPLPQGVLCAFEDRSALEHMDLMRRDFVANVSHELRTPLTALLGFIETLRGPARNDPAARERFLIIMAAEAERMNRLVSDLLHLSRVEAEERVRPSDDVDLAALVRSTAATLRPLAETSRVAIELVGANQPHRLRADRDQMTQVLTNLIENAVKYGSPPGATVRVHLTAEPGPRGPQLRLMVADQGEGIDAVHLPRLTERFYRVDGHRSREKGGTGLGLAIVKHIVSRHRGRLIIDSEPGHGSRFTVLLPQDRA
jgi:two-component system phosphate regulon sensor histidine kinase PhoR